MGERKKKTSGLFLFFQGYGQWWVACASVESYTLGQTGSTNETKWAILKIKGHEESLEEPRRRVGGTRVGVDVTKIYHMHISSFPTPIRHRF